MSSEPVPSSASWWRQLTRYQWFVFTMASLAWVFDCLDQQLFLIARTSAMKELGGGGDPVVLGGYATAVFIAGWATGGLIFGAVGDRIGRAKTLAMTVLLYSVCTGLSAASRGLWDFAIYRFLTGMGVGGVFGLSVALVADSLSDSARPHALGLLQSLSAVGNMTAGVIGVCVGLLELGTIKPGSAWRYLFLIGALPAFLCVFIQLRLKEPERWVKARAEGKRTGVAFGSYKSLFGDERWRGPAIFGMLLCVAGVVGLWGVGFFSPDLVGAVIEQALIAEKVAPEKIPGTKTIWMSLNMIMMNLGAFFGMLLFTKFAQRVGRKRAFAVALVAAFASTVFYFQCLNDRGDIFWMSPIMGFCQLALFAGFAIYLPELFPTRLRSTGVSFCYNVGRFIAASGPWTLGYLKAMLSRGANADAVAKLDAFRDAACWLSSIYLLGLLALPFLPETKGRPLPEDQPA